MEFGGNIFCLSTNNNTHQNGNPNTFTWDSWQQNPATTTTTTSNNNNNNTTSKLLTAFGIPPPLPMPNALIFDSHRHHPYAGDGSHVHPDPHLTCLKLGKRHYFESATLAGGLVLGDKRGKVYSSGSGAGVAPTTTVPRCQVEGCHVALLNAKDYHRRHKVCEIHSKAPKVVVLGMEQRFCQQCSRFHVVSEFDDSKRSCRRRLAGHNERRRKSSHDSLARNSTQGGCALSLLSSRSDSWLSPSDLSTRCSAALRELIAENRAAIMARQLVSDRDWHSHNNHAVEDLKEIQPQSNYFPQQMFPQTQ